MIWKGGKYEFNRRVYNVLTVSFCPVYVVQRTEIFEHAKVLGNPQSVLLTFQPYKLVYAEMLTEAGKTAEALRFVPISLHIVFQLRSYPVIKVGHLESLTLSIEI